MIDSCTGPSPLLRLASVLLVLCWLRPTIAEGPVPFPYELRWKSSVPAAGQSAVVEWDSLVFIAHAEGRLEALRKSDGVRVWLRRDMGPMLQAPVVWQGALLVANAWGAVYSLRADTGVENWSFQRVGGGDCALAVVDGTLYASAVDGWLYALSLDGAERWRARLGPRGALGLQVHDGMVYAGAGAGIAALEASSGQPLLAIDMGARATTSPLVVDQRLFAASGDGYVHAYDVRSGESVWSAWLGAKVKEPMAVVGKRLVCAADNGYLYSIDGREGRIEWRLPMPGGVAGGAVLGPLGELLVGSNRDSLNAVNPLTGQRLWSVRMGSGQGQRITGLSNGFWIAAAGRYAHAFALPARSAPPVPDEQRTWWEVFVDGEKTGYIGQAVRSRAENGWLFEEEHVDWRSGFRRTVGVVEVDSAFRPNALWEKAVEGRQTVSTRAQRSGGVVAVERELAGYVVSDSVQLDETAIAVDALWLKLAREQRLQPGRRDSLRTVDMTHGRGRWVYLDMRAEGDQQGRTAIEVAVSSERNGVPEIVAWVERSGHVVRIHQPGARVERIVADQQRARRWAAPGAERGPILDRSVPHALAMDWLVLELPAEIGNPRSLLVEDAWQRLHRDDAGRWSLRVRKRAEPPLSQHLPFDDPVLRPYMAPSLYVQADDPRVRDLAWSLRGAERDAWTVAMRLRRWVYDHMVPRDTNVQFKSALEVLDDMEGTCSEYAALYMALCRAAGVPVRASVGWLVGQEGQLVPHIWCQIYVGEWVDVDPSQSAEVVGAEHIKTGNGLLTVQGLRQLGHPLTQWIASVDTLSVVEYSADGVHFSRRAADLYAAAVEAERRFDDPRAVELYHQIDQLPWSDRSALALVGIARYRLRRGEWDDAQWALGRLLRADPRGEGADDALFYMARLAAARGDSTAAVEHWQTLVRDFADSDFADDALAELAAQAERNGGCRAALDYYERLREAYSRSGWSAVAASAIDRCR